MFRKCILVVAVFGCALAKPQHQYQQQQEAEGIPPHILREYLAQQQQAAQVTQVLPRPAHGHGAPAARLPYQVQPEYQPQYQSQPQYQPQSQPQPQYQPQPQPQPQYRPQPQPQYRPQPQPIRAHAQEQRDPQEDYDPNPSYQFGFDVNDDQFTNYQNRKEQRDGDVIKGSYSVVDSDGFIRTVTYTADPKEGFKAEVSRQPTDIVVKIPTPKPQLLQQQHHQQQQPQPQHQQQHQPQHQQASPQYYRYQQQ